MIIVSRGVMITSQASIDQGYPWSVSHFENSEQGDHWDEICPVLAYTIPCPIMTSPSGHPNTYPLVSLVPEGLSQTYPLVSLVPQWTVLYISPDIPCP